MNGWLVKCHVFYHTLCTTIQKLADTCYSPVFVRSWPNQAKSLHLLSYFKNMLFILVFGVIILFILFCSLGKRPACEWRDHPNCERTFIRQKRIYALFMSIFVSSKRNFLRWLQSPLLSLVSARGWQIKCFEMPKKKWCNPIRSGKEKSLITSLWLMSNFLTQYLTSI